MSTYDADQYLTQTQNFFQNPDKKNQVNGGCAVVKYVIEHSTGKHCVQKSTSLKLCGKLFQQEVKAVSKFHHPAIIPFIGFAVDNQKGYIYLKEAEKGSLERCLNERRIEMQNDSYKNEFTPLWDDTHKLIIAYGVARAMEYLHSQNTLHRDLNPNNILIDDDLFPYITDFGTTKVVDNAKTIGQTLAKTIELTLAKYMPPEFLNDYMTYNESLPIDVYSYAMVLYRLWTELKIYPCLSELKILQAVFKGTRPEFPKGNYPGENWKKLIKECWDQDPSKRPTFSDICKRLESSDFVTSNIDVQLFEKYKQKFQVDLEI